MDGLFERLLHLLASILTCSGLLKLDRIGIQAEKVGLGFYRMLLLLLLLAVVEEEVEVALTLHVGGELGAQVHALWALALGEEVVALRIAY